MLSGRDGIYLGLSEVFEQIMTEVVAEGKPCDKQAINSLFQLVAW